MRARSLSAAGLAGLLTLLLAAAPAEGGSVGPALPADGTAVRVEVAGLLPRAPLSADEVFQVTGRLVNEGTSTLTELEVGLAVGGVLRNRSALAAADGFPGRGVDRGEPVAPVLDRLQPGEETTFDLRLQVGALGMTQLGVYPLQVLVRGREVDGRRADDLGRATTFVPWFPGGSPAPSRLAFVWPLVGAPVRAPDDALLREDTLASLQDGDGDSRPGRLAALLTAARDGTRGACDPPPPPLPSTAGQADTAPPEIPCRRNPVPLTFTVDPDLLETVDALSREHNVVSDGVVSDGGDGRRSVPGAEAARAWLDELRAVLAGEPATAGRVATPPAALLALPFADPDVVALSRQRSGLRDDVDQLRLLGRRAAEELTGAEPLDTVVQPPPGRLTFGALDAALGGGATAVVLDETALLPQSTDAGRTAGARTELTSASAGRVTGLVVESGLSELLTASPDDPGWQGERLAEQRWVAETAIIAAERPGQSRTFVVSPPRRGTVVPGVAAAALQDAGRLPWLCPVTLVDVVAGTEGCPAEAGPSTAPEAEDRGGLTVTVEPPEDPAEDPLAATYVQEVAEVRARGSQLTDEVLVAGSDEAAAVKARFLRARARAVSSAWRDRPDEGRRMFRLLENDVDGYRDQVQILTSGRQLLTSDTGVIDVSISNALDQAVTVGVQLNDPVEARLTSTDTDVRTVGPAEVVPVRLRVEARTSGQFVVRAALLDRAGQPFGEPAELVVRSTGYGRLALGITGVAAGVLLMAAGVRIVRRALHRPPTGLEDDEHADDTHAGSDGADEDVRA